jgi:hypothetical protein
VRRNLEIRSCHHALQPKGGTDARKNETEFQQSGATIGEITSGKSF